jgi:nickel/cobalt transporter (NicO) family protein
MKNPGIKKIDIKSLLRLTSLIFFLLSGALQANPFFGEEGKSSPVPPPVASGGTGPFTDLQFEYRDKIALLLRQMKSGDPGNLIMIFIAASFLYGLFHAAGPGHRKTIIFSLFLSRKAKSFEPAAAGFLSAGIHAGISVLIIFILWLIQKTIATLADTDRVYVYMEGFTFIILALFAVSLIIFKIISLLSGRMNYSSGTEGKGLYSVIIISSLVPCPGATMLLLLSIYLDLIIAGIAGVVAMSAGMGLIISISGYIAFAGREKLFSRIKKNESMLAKISVLLEIVSYSIILFFSTYMAWPFVFSLAR